MPRSSAVDQWTLDAMGDQTGRRYVITGANSGLGLEMTRQLATRGATVVMAVRNVESGRAAAKRLRSEVRSKKSGAPGELDLEVRHVDLADLDSVRSFASELLATDTGIEVLVNNGGIMMPPRSLSPQGNESQFATNHLGHFALTGLLLERIAASRDPRVVTVSSIMHRQGEIHFDDLTGEHSYKPTPYYAQSKLANALFGLELARRLDAAGSPVASLLAHPGYANTPLQAKGAGVFGLAMKIAGRVLAQSAEKGTLPLLCAATASNLSNGDFVGPDGRGEARGRPTLVSPAAGAMDLEVARRLWDVSESLTGVRFVFPNNVV
jgi:NAD(P)-dependent dehydrogenase (short-subunit alcohol dehydrogenase family)